MTLVKITVTLVCAGLILFVWLPRKSATPVKVTVAADGTVWRYDTDRETLTHEVDGLVYVFHVSDGPSLYPKEAWQDAPGVTRSSTPLVSK